MPINRKACASIAVASIATASAAIALVAGPAAADVTAPTPVYASGAPAPVAYKTYAATTAATATSPVSVTLTMKQTSALDFSVTSVASDSTSGATFGESGAVIIDGSNRSPDTAAIQDFTGTEWDGTIDYSMPGTYTVTDTVTDSNGASATVSVNVTTLGSSYTAVNPTRLLDTRNGTGAARAKVGTPGLVKLKVAGVGPIPADGVTAAVLNVTVTDAAGAGFITVYPSDDGTSAPNVSNVNYVSGQTVPNLVTVQVGSDGYVYLRNSGGGSVDLIADVVGYYNRDTPYQTAGAYVPVPPTRVFDSRGTGNTPLANGAADTLVLGTWADAVNALVANTTVTNTKGDGFLTVYTYTQNVPNASNLNWTRGATVPNLATPTIFDERLNFNNGGGNGGDADVIVDVFGYFQAQLI